MQKIINALAILSFLGTASILGAGTYVYLQKDAIIEGVKEKVTKAAVDGVAGALPGLMGDSMPELPKATGGAIGTSAGGVGFPGGAALPGMKSF